MKYLLPLIFILCFSNTVFAEQPLTKSLVEQYFNAAKYAESIQKKYPDLADKMDNLTFTDKEQFLSTIKGLPIYSEVDDAIKATGLNGGVEQLYDLSMRIIGGVMASKMEQLPPETNVDGLLAMKQMAVEQMQKANMPKEMREQMLKTLKEQEQNLMEMVKLSKNVSAQDKQFIKDNLSWIMENMPQDLDN